MRNSEQERFRQFVNESSPTLYRVALALTGGHHAAEDLIQDALARTFVRWSSVRGDPTAYVRRAMYHAQVSVWRRRSKVRELPAETAPEPADRRDDVGATDQRLALLRLGPRQRAVLVARFSRTSANRTPPTCGLPPSAWSWNRRPTCGTRPWSRWRRTT